MFECIFFSFVLDVANMIVRLVVLYFVYIFTFVEGEF